MGKERGSKAAQCRRDECCQPEYLAAGRRSRTSSSARDASQWRSLSRNSKCFVVAVEQDRDELVSYLERAGDKGNAAALVSFLVFDAVADVKFRSGHFRCSVVEAPAWNRRSLVC